MEDNKKRKPNRLKEYDYSQDGWYFVTMCVKNKIECFGEIKNDKIILNEHGQIILKYWQEITSHYQNIFLDEWVVMPNHIHGIIIIENLVGAEQCSESHIFAKSTVGTEQCSVPTKAIARVDYGLLSKVIKSFKEISVKTIRKNLNDYDFAWQRSFYDHIIRNEKSLDKIRSYIYHNPPKWELDRNNSENLFV